MLRCGITNTPKEAWMTGSWRKQRYRQVRKRLMGISLVEIQLAIKLKARDTAYWETTFPTETWWVLAVSNVICVLTGTCVRKCVYMWVWLYLSVQFGCATCLWIKTSMLVHINLSFNRQKCATSVLFFPIREQVQLEELFSDSICRRKAISV